MAEEFKTQAELFEEDLPVQEVGLADAFIAEVTELLSHDYIDRIHELCVELPPEDAADLLVKVAPEDRDKLVDILEDHLDAETFSYLNTDIRGEILERMTAERIAAIINDLESDDALGLVDDLDADRRQEIMGNLSRRMRAAVEKGLTFEEETAGRIMQDDFVAIPQFWTVGKTVDYLRAASESLPHKFYDIFIVDPRHHLVGTVALDNILSTQRAIKMDSIANEDHISIAGDMDQEEVALLFRRKDLLSAPVVDTDNRLIGVITVDDIIDIIAEEAGEDALKMGGVADTDIYRSVVSTAQSRFIWLFFNLITAIIASAVISQFEGTIEKIVALATLMPIVASMGGNAGTQTLAVAVRALATKELSAANAWRTVVKEFWVGGINGLIFALLAAILTWYWYQNVALGFVIGIAMIINLLAAGLSGIVIPLAIAKLKLDPATSAAVFLTTITDVVGFLAFLGLAALFLT